ncbi:MAG: hypothetical protein AABZ55_03235 [Bdellovibrionota bacterium]
MKNLIMISLLSLSISALAFAGDLDGKTFKGKIGPSNEKKTYEDDLIFKAGTFVSTACETQGHHATNYTSETKDHVTTFVATTTNKEGEKMLWNGTVKGDKAEAKIVTTHADGKTEDWWYKGKTATGMTASKKAKK